MEVRRCVADCPADMRVDVETGIPIDAETVAELRYGLCLNSHEATSFSYPEAEVPKMPSRMAAFKTI